MTPDYASPEQVRGEAVSTVTDVYSLGAVLYQLLTGQRPHVHPQLRSARDRPRRLRDGHPAAEHARAIAVCAAISTPSCMRAMQKEPARRYSSAAELSEDIRRHLDGLPIAARDDSAAYRTMKFVRRHRIGVAATAADRRRLAVGVAVSLHEARVAQRRFAQVRELANTFLFQFYDQVTPLPDRRRCACRSSTPRASISTASSKEARAIAI